MKLADIRTLTRSSVPGLAKSKMNNTILDLIINSVVVEITAELKLLPTNDTFGVVAEQSEYNLASLLTSYLCPDKSGLWWNDGTQWRQIYAKTLKWLDLNRPNWRSLDSADPLEYSIDANILTVVNTPGTTLASGFWLYYIKKPGVMSSNSHYPFTGTTTEYSHLTVLDWVIIYGSRWRAKATLAQYRDEYNQDQNLYLKQLDIGKKLVKQRPDLSSEAQMRGDRIRA